MAIDFSSMQSITDQDMLSAINQAIVGVMLGGQSYEISGRRMTRADLPTLQAMKREYEWRIYRASNGMFVVGATRPPE